jgi:hypothetical protein
MELDGDFVPRTIKDSDGSVITEPVFLDGVGHRLAAGLPPIFLNVDTRKMVSFAPLGIP